ncbi:MAG: beta-ketoacyl synthase N-terminal-like domain-containing protein, partial [Desulfuromonadales bacterium]|nr:beta-ketoacyl synthase N-terminal-like domain-containing protein [Desulfuromonadales bacterium]
MKAVEAQEKPQAPATSPLAIVGIGSLFPQANDTGTFWSNIRQGVDAITEVPESHWRSDDYFDPNPKAPDRVYAKCGGFLAPIDFRPMDYGILPNALEAIDTSQLLGLVAVEQALTDAGYNTGHDYDRDRVSVILGVTGTLELVIPLGARLGHPRWREALRDAGIADEIAADVMQRISDSYVPWQENSFPGLLGNVVAGRISKHFDFGGTNCVVDAACGSSLSALHLAALELESGRADMVVSGGIDTFNDIFMYSCFSKTPALSPSGHARPFDADGDGTTLGEGLGIVILKRLADAERDGDRIYAIIKGIGSSSDGRGAAIYEPSAAGQQKALRRAYRQAGIEPDSIGLIEAHGTGTKVGDAVEVTALRAVFGEARQPWCAIGSIKSQIGHTKAAAGAAGLIKAALALYHKTLPPTLKVKQPLATVTDGASPFYVNSEARPWLAHAATPRRAGVSALGFGGSNFHCLLEEHRPAKPAADWSGDEQLIAFCAADSKRLATAIAEFPVGGTWDEVRLAADRSRRDFDGQKSCRLLVVTNRREQNLAKQLQTAVALLGSRGEEAFWSTPDGLCFGQGSLPGELALLFPGQGTQYPGMLRELAIQFPEFFETVSVADRAFVANAATAGRLSARIYPPPAFTPAESAANEAALRATEIAQPALGAVSLAALEMLRGFGIEATAFAGHSYGELVALCAAGCFDAGSLHALSRLRGELMAAGTGDRGTMLAVAAPLAEIETFLTESGLPLVLANRNTPEQGVLSGATADIERAAQQLTEQGLRQTRLTVSAAFHSPLVADAARPFGERLGAIDFLPPARPVYANSSAAPYPAEVAAARELLAGQLARPVDFVAQIEAMYAAGMRLFLEVGPGARLTGMVKAILGDRPHQALALDASAGKRSGIVDLGRALAQLAALGLPLQLARWDAGYAERQAARPPKKPGLTVTLTGANYFQPPPKRPALAPAAAAAPSPPRELAATAVAPPPATAGPALTDALQISRQSLAALQELQEQTARLHQQFLAGQEAASRTFLSLVEQQNRLLGGATGPLPTPSTTLGSHVTVGAPGASAPETSQPAVAPVLSADSAIDTAPPVASAAGPARERVSAVLLAVIAEKTGYPVEMLEPTMTLDADLGIDSIKRVEILSALQEQLPEAPPVKPEDLGVLQTIGQIVDHLAAAAAPTGQSNVGTVPTATAGLARDQVNAVLLAVIAEKTGYPVEMLEPTMTLDADLGIDSIKRVEILSALQEQLPEAPPVKPEDLGVLQTIGQIVD